MTVIWILVLQFLMLCVVARAHVSGRWAREEEKRDYCETCVRLSECDGVDDNCPWKEE